MYSLPYIIAKLKKVTKKDLAYVVEILECNLKHLVEHLCLQMPVKALMNPHMPHDIVE